MSMCIQQQLHVVCCRERCAVESVSVFVVILFLQGLIPDMEVKNVTKDWNDGIKIAAMVDALAPGLCPEYAEMKPENALENASHAMKLAEDWLGVPMVSAGVCSSPVVNALQ